MCGQACVFYGAADFSRDTDVALPASPENVERLAKTMQALHAEVIEVPPLHVEYLRKGHVVHFRCRHPEANGMRLDVMSVMRGLSDFSTLRERRSSVRIYDIDVDLMALPDLIAGKKTQRDMDWPMIRRLVEAHYVQFSAEPNAERIGFSLTELRTPVLLGDMSFRFPDAVEIASGKRLFLKVLSDLKEEEIEKAFLEEEIREREADRAYWKPLRKELEQMRHALMYGFTNRK
ncbi:MAG: hypothetical protein WCQ99_12535 [Pseudomonadota bacterium]